MDSSRELYLHCEECEWAWTNPNQLSTAAGRLGIDFGSEYASAAEISSNGWAQYALHEDAENV
jgi:hypothetical protein